MVGPEGGRALERSALGHFDDPEGRPLAVEDDEIELREDPHEAPGKRAGPRLRPLALEQCLEGLPADVPGSAQGAVHGGQRVAQGEVPLVYS
jgi:hypothetical protein